MGNDLLKKEADVSLRFKVMWILVLAAGILLRGLYLTRYPAGVNADEAYAGYEAYALLYSGVDSHGYAYPVYFISWGNGMNVLYSYLSIPFQKLLGVNIFSVRLPQVFFGSVTLVAFYWLLRELRDRKQALFGMFLLAITPWHIMMCRWGLESNLVPAFVLFGICFLIKAWKGKSKYYIAAFLMFGLVLYAYAVMWVFIPVLLGIGFIYGLYYNKSKIDKYFILGVAILMILAMPLILFLLVNQGYIAEIRTPFISVPKMDSMRSGEISLENLLGKFKDFLVLIATQQDRDIFNTSNVGIYYFCSIPFLITGLGKALCSFAQNVRKKQYQDSDIMLLWFGAACVVACFISYVNVNKINCVHLPIIYFIVDGIGIWAKKLSNKFMYIVLAVYLAFFVIFAQWYFDEEKHYFYYGYEDALDYAENITDGEIGTVLLRYSIVLLHSQILPEEYWDTIQDTKNFGMAKQFGRYLIEPSEDSMRDDVVYVVPKISESTYSQNGFSVQYDNGYYVVLMAE